jgi:hypothetical protein
MRFEWIQGLTGLGDFDTLNLQFGYRTQGIRHQNGDNDDYNQKENFYKSPIDVRTHAYLLKSLRKHPAENNNSSSAIFGP